MELSLACRALAGGYVNNFIHSFLHRAECGTYRLEVLCFGRTRLGNDAPLLVTPVKRHGKSSTARTFRSVKGFEEHLLNGVAKGERKRQITIIRIRPVVARLQCGGSCNLCGFMSRPADVEKHFSLS